MAREKKPRTALMCTMDLLAMREHFTKELLRKLRQRDFEEVDIETAIQTAQESGWQSDERACESYVRMRINKGYGPIKIRSELYDRGASAALIETWLLTDQTAWCDVLRSLGEKRYGITGGAGLSAKQLRFFWGRGFSAEIIERVFGTAFPTGHS